MYIEELVIDNYLTQLQQWEGMDEDQQWETPRPVMPEIVAYYEGIGQLWLDSESSSEALEVAPDILG